MRRERRRLSELFTYSLSVRVLWLTIGLIMSVEFLFLIPSLGREREAWLWQ